MEVYVLLGWIDYEGESLLGVYHTQADAEAARDEYVSSVKHGFDSYNIEHRVIGARAEWRF